MEHENTQIKHTTDVSQEHKRVKLNGNECKQRLRTLEAHFE